jgi:Reverse transcriptase (RNA-dependent DNA polymerase)
MAVIHNHSAHVNRKGPLMKEDIPCLHEEWMKSCEDIMRGVLEQLPLLREVNHWIPLIDKSKQYQYHSPRCPDSLKPELKEKIACYTCAGWWEPAQMEPAGLMLCMHKKNMKLWMVVDGCQCNENMVKDVTPLPDQDVICLNIVRVKICSKIDLSDAYEQICIVPEDVHKMAFGTIFRTFMSNVMQQGDCNAPSTFQCSMNITFWEFIGIFLHMYLDDLFVYSNTVEEHQQHLKKVFAWLCECRFYMRVVFKGPVAWTKRMTATQPNPTDCNWTISCSCLVWGLVGLPVALIQKYLKTLWKPVAIDCNRSSYSV